MPAVASVLTYTNADEFRVFIENQVLHIITQVIEKGVPKETVQQMAKQALDLIKPGMAMDELYRASTKLDDQFSEFAPVVFGIMEEYEQKYEKRAVDQVSQLVKSGNYDDAETLVKKVLEFKTF